jgi:hypothetical protein
MTDEISLSGLDTRLDSLVAAAGEPLLRGDEFFRQLMDALPAAVYTTDTAGRMSFGVIARTWTGANGAGRGNCIGRTGGRCPTTNVPWPSR